MKGDAAHRTLTRPSALPGTQGAWERLRQMLTIRRVEEQLLELFSRGLLFGTVHTCIGQEACAVGIVGALDRSRDVVWSNHRGHGHYLAYCDDVEGLIAEIMGRSTGCCAGIGGSQHLQRQNFYTNGILGGTLPSAVGSALAEKRKGTGAIATVFFGDGACGEGALYESLNLAALWRAPVLFVLEDNGIAQSTPSRLEHAGWISRRAEPFDIESRTIVIRDVEEVHEAAVKAVARVRSENRPLFLVLETFRLGPHSKGDDTRPAETIASRRGQDPLLRLRAEWGRIAPGKLAQLEADVVDRVMAAVAAAQAAPFLPEAELLRKLEGV